MARAVLHRQYHRNAGKLHGPGGCAHARGAGDAHALPDLLVQLQAGGYRVVQLKAKDTVATLPEYDAAMAKAQTGQTSDGRPTASVVRTIGGYVNQ